MLCHFSLGRVGIHFFLPFKFFARNDSNESSKASPLEATPQRTSQSVTNTSRELNSFLVS